MKTTTNNCDQNTLDELKKGKEFLEKFIEHEKITEFKKNVIWTGAAEDLSLYKFYKKIESNINALKNPESHKNNVILLDDNVNMKNVPKNAAEGSGEGDGENLGNNSVIECSKMNVIETSPIPSETLINDRNHMKTPMLANSLHNTPSTSSGCPSVKIISDIIIQNASSPSPVKANNQIVPSPFKRALMWPEPMTTKKKRLVREKIPSVVTSKQWQEYYQKKENKKKEEEDRKKQRAEERQKKKEIQEKLKLEKSNKPKKVQRNKKDSSSDSETSAEWEASDHTDDEVSLFAPSDNMESPSTSLSRKDENSTCDNQGNKYKENDYILVKFPGKKREHRYVCVIQELLAKNEAEVVAMKKCEDGKSFKLNETDVSLINLDQIIEKLTFPEMTVCGDRLKYHFDKDLNVDG